MQQWTRLTMVDVEPPIFVLSTVHWGWSFWCSRLLNSAHLSLPWRWGWCNFGDSFHCLIDLTVRGVRVRARRLPWNGEQDIKRGRAQQVVIVAFHKNIIVCQYLHHIWLNPKVSGFCWTLRDKILVSLLVPWFELGYRDLGVRIFRRRYRTSCAPHL